jgi:hypothetical protein
MAGEFIKDPPKSGDPEAKKLLRNNGGMRGVGTTKAPKRTKSNGAVGARVAGRRISSGAASVRGGAA